MRCHFLIARLRAFTGDNSESVREQAKATEVRRFSFLRFLCFLLLSLLLGFERKFHCPIKMSRTLALFFITPKWRAVGAQSQSHRIARRETHMKKLVFLLLFCTVATSFAAYD